MQRCLDRHEGPALAAKANEEGWKGPSLGCQGGVVQPLQLLWPQGDVHNVRLLLVLCPGYTTGAPHTQTPRMRGSMHCPRCTPREMSDFLCPGYTPGTQHTHTDTKSEGMHARPQVHPRHTTCTDT